MSFKLNGVGLTHANGFTALADIRLQADQGERIALIGPSGAGKTSLLSVLGTALAPTAGSARISRHAGTSRCFRCPCAARIGTVHQAPPIPGRQRVVTAVLAGKLGAMAGLEIAGLPALPARCRRGAGSTRPC